MRAGAGSPGARSIVVTAAGVASAGWVPAVVLVQRWFPRRVGVALGITSAGIGVGIFLLVPVTQLLVDQLGWRLAFRCLAAAVALWIVPVTLDEALGMERFRLLSAAQLLGSLACQMLLVHQVAHLVDHRIPALVAASVVSVVGLTSIVGKAGGGWFSDTAGAALSASIATAALWGRQEPGAASPLRRRNASQVPVITIQMP